MTKTMPRLAAVAILLALLLVSTSPCADRAQQAQVRRGAELRSLLGGKKLPYPPREIFIRAFKRERVLEVWARERGDAFVQVLSLPFCAASGTLGPKHAAGDMQVPEGFYHLNRFNPHSSYYLSLGLDYPNQADRRRATGSTDLGRDIFIHGSCVSIGCIALTDQGIEPVYLLAVGARQRGQHIPVHIFPTRLDDQGVAWLRAKYHDQPSLLAFWDSLRPAFAHFERHHRVPAVSVDGRGNYRLAGAASR
jgi:murein L,D-transpeptidase YafK